jgi:2-phosphoglycerate kinase
MNVDREVIAMDGGGRPPWSVLLLCGASGTGKTQVSYPLARHYGVPIVEVDDLVEALQAMTTPEQQPILHYWRTHPEAARLPPADIADLQVAVAEALVPAVDAIVGNHLETDTPVIIEGDYLLPSLATRDGFAGIPAKGRVAAVVLHEPDEAQIVANYLRREPGLGEQFQRARVSALYGDRLAGQAAEAGVPTVTARPWTDVIERVIAAVTGTQ